MRSFADRSTHFHVVVSDTPITVDGFALGEPTGQIECCECRRTHKNIDEIPHKKDCSQRFVHSQWYAESMENE
ncbi:hypothetical protein [Haloprofundus halobius]|uniref:hypothetical protein n=1 Tax=Haloprofundus halobius TaxID=2876194 RepID=UPI001CCFF424|nr:hypothetical protein [Haloprofundus halobius]